MSTFHVAVDQTWDLTVTELWPDGDAPDVPTKVDAAVRVRDYIEHKGIEFWLRDWNMDDLDVTVEGIPVARRGRVVSA